MDEREEDFYEALYTQSQAQFNTYLQAGTVLNNYAHIFDILIRCAGLCFGWRVGIVFLYIYLCYICVNIYMCVCVRLIWRCAVLWERRRPHLSHAIHRVGRPNAYCLLDPPQQAAAGGGPPLPRHPLPLPHQRHPHRYGRFKRVPFQHQ